MASEHQRELWRNRRKRYYKRHTEICLERIRIIKKRWVEERRCSMCGSELIDSENKTCVNCSGTQKGELTYAKNCQRLAKEF